jgi:hypothetical protein
MRNTAVQMFATKVMALDITPKQMLYFLDWYQLALEMEKQQIIQAHGKQLKKTQTAGNYEYYLTGEQYYQETYEKDA